MNDLELTQRFEDGSFPFQQWDHRAHLKIAYLYLVQYPFMEAMERMRRGLQRLIRDNQIPETQGSGYHETITRAWMQLIDTALREHGPARDADCFLREHPQLCNKRILRLFYSQDRLLSSQAKIHFVDPDLAPLPSSSRPMVPPPADDSATAITCTILQDNHVPC